MPRHALRARLKGPRRKLESKVALVTGSGCGIGRAIALKLAREGAWIVVNDRDAESTNVVLAELKAAGAQAISVIGPVNDDGFAARFVGAAMEQFGTIDIVVNNAGYTWDASIQKATDEQFQTMLDVHVMAPFRILRAAAEPIRLAAKKDAAEGREVFRKVVNISSVAGLFSNPGQVSYASAKASLIGMTKTLSKEWERYKVNVNCVAFGLINTRLTQPIEAGKSADRDRRTRDRCGHPAGYARDVRENDPDRSGRHAGGSSRCGISAVQPRIELHQRPGTGLRRWTGALT